MESILLLQPTHTAAQKKWGTRAHYIINGLAFSSLLVGLVVIEYNKFSYGGAHFQSLHAILGVLTSGLVVVQVLVGHAQYHTPWLLGGEARAKALYKYHRMSGYFVLLMFLATVAAATQTTFNRTTLHIRLWTVLLASVLTLAGVLPRIQKRKLGFR